ncbi:MAG: hypothetical protein ABI921_01655 [Panacibacter sp.]
MTDNSFISGKTKVYIHAACNVFYASYYIAGMKLFFGKRNVYFNVSRFPRFNEDLFAAIIETQGLQKKIIIDFLDDSKINNDALSWCDIYGKVNLEKSTYDNQPQPAKIIPVGPYFSIRIWNLSTTVYYAISNFLKAYKVLHGYKKFLSNYKQQYSRSPIDAYTPGKSLNNYVFMLNSIWKRSPQTNNNRLSFIKACKSIKELAFEGGFAPRQNKDFTDFDAYTTSKWYPVKSYIEKTKQSAVVYNTPAVLGCHGWKLGEFLAMGKAMISTPLSRLMPADLINQVHYYEVNDSTNYAEAIQQLLIDDALRQKLERNARDYYEKYLSPQQVIAGIIASLL